MIRLRGAAAALLLAAAGAAQADMAQHAVRQSVAGVDVVTYHTEVKDVVDIIGYLPAGDAMAGSGNAALPTLMGMMLDKGTFEGKRYLKPETVSLMLTNRLTPAQRAIPFLGAIPMWEGMGFGLGVSIIDHPDKVGLLGMGPVGCFGWPGAFGTWWQADPANDLVMIYLIQNSVPLEPGAIATLAAGQRMGARAALPMFQRLAYDALT